MQLSIKLQSLGQDKKLVLAIFFKRFVAREKGQSGFEISTIALKEQKKETVYAHLLFSHQILERFSCYSVKNPKKPCWVDLPVRPQATRLQGWDGNEPPYDSGVGHAELLVQ